MYLSQKCLLTSGIAAAVCLTFTASPAAAECELTKVRVMTGEWTPDARFGAAVAISDDFLVVGAPEVAAAQLGSGAAYVFRRVGTEWIKEARLTASDPGCGDQLGSGVSVSGNVVVVGASGKSAAYVFRRFFETWHEEAKLIPTDGTDGDEFGFSVSISGGYALVGASRNDTKAPDAGAAYVFKSSGAYWNQEAALTASDAGEDDRFGCSVSISGDIAVVGADRDDEAGVDAGAAYVFRLAGNEWVEEAKLTATDGASSDLFGWAVSVDGEHIVVGAVWDDDAGSVSGSAYVFRHDGDNWVEEAKLIASDGDSRDRFGYSVAINGPVVVIGAPYDDDFGQQTGSAYVFLRHNGEWTEDSKLTASDGTSGDRSGYAVGAEGGLVATGSPFRSKYTTEGYWLEGAAYVFGVAGDCNDDGIPDPCEIAEGISPDCSGNGIPDGCEPDCNANDNPDTCDMVDGISLDCDDDEIPDECETDHDADGDGIEDCLDGCPNDPDKVAPGQCDCGIPDDDWDADGTPDCLDLCPDDPDKVHPGVCGCAVPDEDSDGDGVIDCAALMALVPVDASGPHVIVGNQIMIPSGGLTVTLEIRAANWGPKQLRVYQATIDALGYASGSGGTLVPLGWDGPMPDIVCYADDDCPDGLVCWVPQGADGGICAGPGHDPESGAFIDASHPDYVFGGLPTLNGIDVSSLWYRYGNFITAPEFVDYQPPPKYCGTLILVVPEGAAGTFTIGFDDYNTFLVDSEGTSDPFSAAKPPRALESALITIQPPTCGNGECELGEDEASCPVDCAAPVEPVPTVSAWGIVILAMLLLVRGKISFGRRRIARA